MDYKNPGNLLVNKMGDHCERHPTYDRNCVRCWSSNNATRVEMKTKQEIEAEIQKTEHAYGHLLAGSLATVENNSPRALGQIAATSKLQALHWTLGTKYKSELKGHK